MRITAAKSKNSLFKALCERYDLPAPETEVKFHPTRRWRFDYCWPDRRVAVEINGGIWNAWKYGNRLGGSAHGTPFGILRDMEKVREAQALGWKVLSFTPQEIMDPKTYELLRTVL